MMGDTVARADARWTAVVRRAAEFQCEREAVVMRVRGSLVSFVPFDLLVDASRKAGS